MGYGRSGYDGRVGAAGAGLVIGSAPVDAVIAVIEVTTAGGGLDPIVDGDTITVDGVVYTFRDDPSLPYEVSTVGAPGENLRNEINGPGQSLWSTPAHPSCTATSLSDGGGSHCTITASAAQVFVVTTSNEDAIEIVETAEGQEGTPGTAGDMIATSNALFICIEDSDGGTPEAWRTVAISVLA